MQFADIETSDWFYQDILVAAQYELVSGFGDGQFKPNDTITREQMAVILANALQVEGGAEEKENVFLDQAKISSWARSDVEQIVKLGIMNGKSKLSFAPQDEATRAEAVIVLIRMLHAMNLL